MPRMILAICSIGLFLLAVNASPAAAALLPIDASASLPSETIRFNPLSGDNKDGYTGHVEGDFAVTPLSGDWREGHAFGNPYPNIFSGPIGDPLAGVVSVTQQTTGLFNFHSVDLVSNTNDSALFIIAGIRNGAEVFSLAGELSVAGSFQRVIGPDSTAVLDELHLGFQPNTVSSVNIDNIGVTTVPAPLAGVAGLVAFGLVAARRPRRAVVAAG